MAREAGVDYQNWIKAAGPHSHLGRLYRRMLEKGVETKPTEHGERVQICEVEEGSILDLHGTQEYKEPDMKVSEQLRSDFIALLKQTGVSDAVFKIKDGLPGEIPEHYDLEIIAGKRNVCIQNSEAVSVDYSQKDPGGVVSDGSIVVSADVPYGTDIKTAKALRDSTLEQYKNRLEESYPGWEISYGEVKVAEDSN
jgi:hypothetical protein